MKTTHCTRAIITSLSVRGIAIFAVCALGLPMAVLAKAKKTPFTGTETMTGQDVGTQFTDGTNAFLTGTRLYALEEMIDPRVSGHSTIGFNAIIDLESFSGPHWGSFHLENAGTWCGGR